MLLALLVWGAFKADVKTLCALFGLSVLQIRDAHISHNKPCVKPQLFIPL